MTPRSPILLHFHRGAGNNPSPLEECGKGCKGFFGYANIRTMWNPKSGKALGSK